MEGESISKIPKSQPGNPNKKQTIYPYNDPTEESLIPSNLLNESEIELSPKNFPHKNIQPYPHPQKLNSLIPPLIPFININIIPPYFFYDEKITKLVSQIKTHQGSIYLQYSLSLLNTYEISTLLFYLSPHLTELMCSHYGNYFIQKLFLKLDYFQRLYIFNLIQYNFISLCSDSSGTYSIQTLIDSINSPKEEMILQNLLCSNLLYLFCNENAHHVIQKIIIDYPEHKREYINNFMIQNADKICTNEYGALCAMKFIIMNSNLNLRFDLLKELDRNFFIFISNKFGSNILKFFIEKYGLVYCSVIVSKIKNNLFKISLQDDYAENVVEKVINMIYEYDIKEYMKMTWTILKNEKFMKKVILNKNGSKLVSAVLEHGTYEQRAFLKEKKLNFCLNDKIFDNKKISLII